MNSKKFETITSELEKSHIKKIKIQNFLDQLYSTGQDGLNKEKSDKKEVMLL